jgi:hypothetical protein
MDGDETRASEAVEAMNDGGGGPAEELAAVREVVLRAYPDAVPELVVGASVAEVLASVEGARSAYRRVAAAVAADGPRSGEPVTIPVVPAGATRPVAVDPERLPAAEKIRRGLARRSTES